MGVWQQDKITGEWGEFHWECIDTKEDPVKKGYLIFNVYLNKQRTKQKMMCTDKNGVDHEIQFVKM